MAKFILAWDTANERQGGLSALGGLEVVGKELRVADLGITNAKLAGSISDDKLNQITTANKVAGSAVELQAAGAIENVSGLGLKINDDILSINGSNELEIDYVSGEFQVIPGQGLSLNIVPTSKLESNVVLTDGSRAFTAPQGGVDAVAGSDFVTLSQAQGLVTGDFGEQLLNLAGQTANKGNVGYVESTSGAFRLARADDPSTAIVQYVAKEDVADGASGTFNNPSTEIDEISALLAGIDRGGKLFLSTANWGEFQATAPSVSGQTILECGWKAKDDKMVFFPGDAIDL